MTDEEIDFCIQSFEDKLAELSNEFAHFKKSLKSPASINWIKCADRMPEDGAKVLVSHPFYDYVVVEFVFSENDKGYWLFDYDIYLPFDEVTHWAELEPPNAN